MKIAARRKAIYSSIAVVGLIVFALFVWARDYGPYTCATCRIGAPTPDMETYTYLSNLAPIWSFRWTERGNTYIVCNGSACGYYRVTNSGDFHGDKVVPQSTTPPNSGSSGSGGGSGASGGGTVTVGDPNKLGGGSNGTTHKEI